jgi:hypothetical protein
MGSAISSMGSGLKRASTARSLTLETPDGPTTMRFDPTMTQDARAEERQLRVHRATARPEPNRVKESIDEYVGKQEYDRKHRVGDFAPREPRAGAGRVSPVDPVTKERYGRSQAMADNARADLAASERAMPKRPDFSELIGSPDSAATHKAYTRDSTAGITRVNRDAKRAMEWSNTTDSLARVIDRQEAGQEVGGGFNLLTRPSVAANLEVLAEGKRFTQEVNEGLREEGIDPRSPEGQRRTAEAAKLFQSNVARIAQKHGANKKP